MGVERARLTVSDGDELVARFFSAWAEARVLRGARASTYRGAAREVVAHSSLRRPPRLARALAFGGVSALGLVALVGSFGDFGARRIGSLVDIAIELTLFGAAYLLVVTALASIWLVAREPRQRARWADEAAWIGARVVVDARGIESLDGRRRIRPDRSGVEAWEELDAAGRVVRARHVCGPRLEPLDAPSEGAYES